METLNSHYRVARHVVSSVYELACTLLVTHRRARRLALYTAPESPRAAALPW